MIRLLVPLWSTFGREVLLEMKVDRVRANHSLRLTASQGTPNIPFHWFQLLGSYRQAQKKEIIAWLSVRSKEVLKPMNVIKHLLA